MGWLLNQDSIAFYCLTVNSCKAISQNPFPHKGSKTVCLLNHNKKLLNMLLIQVPLTRFSQMLRMQIVDCAAAF